MVAECILTSTSAVTPECAVGMKHQPSTRAAHTSGLGRVRHIAGRLLMSNKEALLPSAKCHSLQTQASSTAAMKVETAWPLDKGRATTMSCESAQRQLFM